MHSRTVHAVWVAPDVEPGWIWTAGGRCVGYRRGNSLYTPEGVEIGQFSGSEVYGVDGSYLGELSAAQDGSRLVANLYKKSQTILGFDPRKGPAYKAPSDRAPEQLCCGHEDFRVPAARKASNRGVLRARIAAF